MKRKKNPFSGLIVLSTLFLGVSITASIIMESYRVPLDDLVGTTSSQTVTEITDDEDEIYNYHQDAKTAKEAFDNYKEFALRQSEETIALLKNENSSLPLNSGAKVTMMGLRSYAAFYGNNGGSIPDFETTTDNTITQSFKDEGFDLNPSMLETYETYCSGLTWGIRGFGASAPEYSELRGTSEIFELSLSELESINSDYDSEYAEYDDAAIVVVGRPGGENNNYYLQDQTTGDNPTTTGNIMGLSAEEKEIIEEAKANFDNVVVIINSTNTMEFKELVDDPEIDSIVWAGHPGAYGWHSVAKVLNGEVNPSAHLGDIYVTNNAANPAMQSFGNIPWENADEFPSDANVNSYLVEAEGIYTGYRYYETRYADIVMNRGTNPATAKARTYTNEDYTLATSQGTWDYDHEVIYPFGYGLSYTTFEQTLDSVRILGNKESATVTVTVRNSGNESGKSVVQLYGQAPYTGEIEKSAIQLMDFEKTRLLNPGESQTITMEVDMENIASCDADGAGTFVVEGGEYYFAIGDDSHDALNNILTAQGHLTTGDSDKTYSWHWDYDDTTFAVTDNETEIKNQLSNDDNYSMDLNDFLPNTVTYFSRDDYNATFPESYAGLSATGKLVPLLENDFIPLKTNDDTSMYKWGVESELNLIDFKGADWDDPRWDELVDKVTPAEFVSFAGNAFHNIAPIPSVGYTGNNADDGPGGSDSHYLQEGYYRDQQFTDAEEYTGYGSRVTASCTNIAYSWNKELAYENGEIILGETSLMFKLPIIIGPAMNIHRHGYNGRGGEYYSEDPILSGFIGSAVIQGAMSKGVLVNIKHAAFNDQEINRSGISVFMNEQKARELELRNLRQAFEGKGKPASFRNNSEYDDTYTEGANGVMTSYNRIGAVASSANYNLMVNILREEWGFKGYNVTDFTGVSLKAAPKESLLAGTTAFCGFGGGNFDYWQNPELLTQDAEMCAALKKNIKYVLYSLANSNAMNGVNSTTHVVQLMTWWRATYISLITVFSITTALGLSLFIWKELANAKKEEE